MSAQFALEAREPRPFGSRTWRRPRPAEWCFYPLIDAQATLGVEALRARAQLPRDVRDPAGRVREIETFEKRADGVNDQLRARLPSPASVLALCAQVDDIVAQADHVLRAAMSRLFREEPDARRIVKLKAVYEVLESLTDMCKDVADALEAIVLKHG